MRERHILRKEEDGQAMVEFVIVFPVLFLFFLTIVQSALLMSARQVVNYASFCAARAAMVGFPEEETARAAQLACASICPRISVAELSEYSGAIGNIMGSLARIASQYPELAAQIYSILDNIPGLNISIKLNNITSPGSMQGLTAGLAHMDTFAEGSRSVSARFPASYVLTTVYLVHPRNGDDVTAWVTHNYAMRVPVINKIFYAMYLNFLVDRQIAGAGGSLPGGVVNELREKALDAFDELSKSSLTVPLYVLPIRAKCTLPVEKEITHGACCD